MIQIVAISIFFNRHVMAEECYHRNGKLCGHFSYVIMRTFT